MKAPSLTERLVLEERMTTLLTMRRLYGEGETLRAIAEVVGLDVCNVSRILRGLAYQDAHQGLRLDPLTMRKRGRKKKIRARTISLAAAE